MAQITGDDLNNTLTSTTSADTMTGSSGDDIQADSGTFTIPAGAISTTIDVTILDDTEVESTETFQLRLSNMTQADLSGGGGDPDSDIAIVQRGVVSKAAGGDRYVFSPATIDANASISISDVQGANIIQLMGGLSIQSAIVASNTALLTLTNGAEITVLGASSFTYETGGNPLAGTAGVTHNYTDFVANILGSSVPQTGTTDTDSAVTINADGSATAGTGGSTGGSTAGPNDDILIVQRGVASKAAGDDTYVLSSSTVDADAEIIISDNQGSNTIQLFEGLSIASSIVASNTALLTLTNGAEITVLGASSFTYEAGGDPLTGASGAIHDYAGFVSDILGTTLPNSKDGGEFNNDEGARDAIDQITDDNAGGTFTTAGEGDFGISTAQSGSVINVDAFRQAPQYRDIDGSGYTVVILDTGIDLNHNFFGADADGNGISDRIIYTQDFTNEGDGTTNDVNGHGTNVASIAASSSSAYPGIAPGANIIALQVLPNTGLGSFSYVEEALQWVVANAERYNITAINMSFGDSENYTSLPSPNLYGIVDELSAIQSLGIISVAAAGNEYFNFQTSGVSFPAIVPSVIAVGATFDANVGNNWSWESGAKAFTTGVDEIIPFSQRGVGLTDIFAPGALIEGAAVGGGVEGKTGTSQASPHIAGIAVLAQQLAERELGRRLTTDEFVDLLQTTGVTIFDGDDEDDNVVNTNQSYQRVDVLAMADAIVALGGGSGGTVDIAGNLSTTAELSAGSSLSSVIGANGDTDWIKIWLNSGTKYTFDLKANPSGVGTLQDPWLGLYNASGIFVTSDDDSGTDVESSLDFTPTQTGYYYLSAESYGLVGTGTYVLSASGSGANDDYSGDRNTSGVVAMGGSATGIINFSGDRDWFKVQLIAGQNYSFLLNGSGLSDPYLELYGSTGASVLAADDDSGAGYNSLLEFTAFSSGTHYLSVRGYSTEVGGYTLQASQQNTASVSDIVLRNTNNGEIGVWDFTEGGAFTFHTIQNNLGLNWKPQLTANLVTRGNDDMVLRDTITGTIGYWDFGDNGQRTWNIIQDNLDTLWQAQGSGDFTLDGRDDIILRNTSTGEIGYWDFEPNGAIDWISLQDDLGTNWQVQGAGDITNNGFDDIILRDVNMGTIGYWKFGANGADWTVIQDNLGLNWQVNDVADIANDGHSDIILREVNTGAIGYWDFSNGGANWSFIEIQNDLSLDWQVHGTGDFTGDQNEDIVLRNITTGDIGYWDFKPDGGLEWIEIQANLGLNWQVQGTADIWGV